MAQVCLTRCDDYSPAAVEQAVARHFSQMNYASLLHPGCTVMIKPNLIMGARPERACTTHPEVVAAVARQLKQAGAGRIVLADSPGGLYNERALRSVYIVSGMAEMAEREGIELNFHTGARPLVSEKARVCSQFDVIEPVFDCDLIVDIAKLKTHGMTGYSGAVKNLFGVLPGLTKPEYHYRYQDKDRFSQMLIDLCEGVRPAICFIDGVIGMEGNGPTGGNPRPMKVLLSSNHPYALDLVGISLIGMNPDDALTVKASLQRELCPKSLENITFKGDGIADFRVTDYRMPESKNLDFFRNFPGFIAKPMNKLLTPRPKVRAGECVGCGKCAESCPVKTISVINKKAVIDRKKCIKCYCCHEMCPIQAIELKKFGLLNL